MAKHPQLQSFIDEIKRLHTPPNKRIKFHYKPGHNAFLSVVNDTITVTSDNKLLVKGLGELIERILSGNVRGALDKPKE